FSFQLPSSQILAVVSLLSPLTVSSRLLSGEKQTENNSLSWARMTTISPLSGSPGTTTTSAGFPSTGLGTPGLSVLGGAFVERGGGAVTTGVSCEKSILYCAGCVKTILPAPSTYQVWNTKDTNRP